MIVYKMELRKSGNLKRDATIENTVFKLPPPGVPPPGAGPPGLSSD